MKRLLFTILAILAFVACSSAQDQRAKTFKYGIKVLGSTTISSIPGTSNLMVLNDNGYSMEISLADLISQLNLATGNLTQEEVEDIIGPALENGNHTGATFVYNDNGAGVGTIDANITGGSVTLDASILNGSTNGVENNAIYDRFLTTVNEAATSPEESVFWRGTKAEFYSEYGNPPTGLQDYFYVITDSIPPTPVGGGDMLRSNYDADNNNVVDNAEQLNGQAPSFYLDNTDIQLNETQVDAFVANNGYVSATEGIFTPTVVALTSGGYTSASSTGYYTKVGKMVSFQIAIIGINDSGTPTGTFAIGNLPFNAKGGGQWNYCNVLASNFGLNFYSIIGEINSSNIYIYYQSGLDSSHSSVGALNLSLSNATLRISGTYITN